MSSAMTTRRRYVEGLATVLKPVEGCFFSLFSDKDRGTSPRRVSRKEIEDTFAKGWVVVESIEPSHYEVRPDPNDISFSEGGTEGMVRCCAEN